MSYGKQIVVVVALVVFAALAVASPAAAAGSATGGSSAEEPTVAAVRCSDGRTRACAAGETLTLRGEALSTVDEAVFLGRRGRRDNVAAEPAETATDRVELAVPAAAVTGRVKLLGGIAPAKSPVVKLDEPKTKATSSGFVFPIRGKHKIGTNATQRFGGSRGHQGQDIFATCGKTVVAAIGGTVHKVAYHGAAGNYVVIDGLDGRSYAYMHLLEASEVEEGDTVATGKRLGQVGETGRASGCHLHFEIWTAPGWYRGGSPVDPYDELRTWE